MRRPTANLRGTFDQGEYDKDPLFRVLRQNLRVLGTGQRIENRPGDKPQIVPTVTLEVSPAEGERLALAAQAGRISLVLRGQGDSQLVLTRGGKCRKSVRFDRKSPTGRGCAEIVHPRPRRATEIIRGLQREPVNL